MTGDMCRRTLRCRLVSPQERPEDRDGLPDLEEEVLRDRAELVAAGLTVLRAFFEAGRPDVGVAPMGNFDRWRKLIAGSIRWATGVDVVETRVLDDAVYDPSTEAYAAFLAAAPSDGKARTVREWSDLPLPNVREALALAIPSTEPNREVRLGRWLAKRKDQVMGGRRLVATVDSHTRIKRYTVILTVTH